ncbi:MAG: HPF/RaiA family ribosome-associated protein [Patescibacteria group bacterium]
MNIHFKNSGEALPSALVDRIQKKLTKLGKFITERNYEAQIFVDVRRESGANTSDKMWRAALNLDLAGDRFNASEAADTPEKASELAIRELTSELRKAHAKSRSESKRGGSVLKRLMRGFR